MALYDSAQRAEMMREDADYDATPFSANQAEQLRQDAERFVEAVTAMLAG